MHYKLYFLYSIRYTPFMVIHQLVFVDDESIVREGVKTRVAWGQNGFNLAGVFENGLDAYKFIEENKVDAVISDINMPRMDGLELSRVISENHPEIIVILLTGYDEFEYAQNAVKYKVRDFLLKPVTAAELESILKKLHDELSRKKKDEEEHSRIMKMLEMSFPLLRERFFNRLVTGKLSHENVLGRKDFYQWVDLEGVYRVVTVGLMETCEDVNAFMLIDYCIKIKGPGDEVFSDRDGNIIFLLQDESEASIDLRARTMAEKTFLYAESLSLAGVYIGIGGSVGSIGFIQQSYRESRNAADYARVAGFSRIVSSAEITDRGKLSLFKFQIFEDGLKKQLREGSRDSTFASFEKIIELLRKYYVSRDELAYYFSRLHTLINNFLMEMDMSSLLEESPPPPSVFTSVTAAEEYFKKQLDGIEGRIQEHRNSVVYSRIERAKDVIAERYSDKNFSLQTICSELFISTSQFSVIFKEGTGQTFVEYLTEYRIAEAKKLLKNSDMKSYEIAETIGFADPRYFSIIFKKHTGLTPMEYRRSLEE